MIWKSPGPVPALAPHHEGHDELNPFPIQAPTFLATHGFDTAPPLDILFVPGGMGNRVLHEQNDTVVEDFIAARYPALTYLASVCTGSASLAKSGVLNGKRATTNKGAWNFSTEFGEGVQWVASARWTEDGNIWTSSGVAAGRFSLSLNYPP